MPRVYDTEKVLALYQRIVEDDARCAELLEELESQVDNRGPGACWPWNGVVTDTGYALFQFKVDGKEACHSCGADVVHAQDEGGRSSATGDWPDVCEFGVSQSGPLRVDGSEGSAAGASVQID